MLSRPHFERSISLNDLDSSTKVREHVQQDIVTPPDDSKHSFLKSASQFTFVLQSFKDFPIDYKKFLYSYLVDFVVFRDLEECRRLNWCESLFPMVPILTMGDGNCLMHAASIGMWAVNDRYNSLRKLVYNALLEDIDRFYHKRWQRELEVSNLSLHGYKMTEEQWDKEWQIVLELVSQNEYPLGNNGMRYSSLEEIHIFVLANVLRRTIIVISNDMQRGNYDESLTPLNFPGIYLPLKWDPVDCVKTPLVIGYSHGHFTAVVSFEDGVFDRGEVMDDCNLKIHGVPLEQSDGVCLPVHFLFEDEVDISDGLLRQYLDCTKVHHKDPHSNKDVTTLAAKLHFIKPPGCMAGLVDGFFSSAHDTYTIMLQQKNDSQNSLTPSLHLEPCKTEGCEFFGTYETLNLCSKCLEEYLKKSSGQGDRVETVLSSKVDNAPQHQQQQQYEQKQQQQLPQQTQQQQLQSGLQQQHHNQQQQIMTKPQELMSYVLSREQNAGMASIVMTPCANKINGCEFFGIPQQEGFCSRCYERFCSGMQSLHNENMNTPRAKQGSQLATQGKACQTQGCSRPGCPELHDRCVECYGDCIKQFIHKHEGQSMQSISLPSTKKLPPSHAPPKLCITSGCQNEGRETLRGHCDDCYQIMSYGLPFEIQRSTQLMPNRVHESALPLAQHLPSYSSLLYCRAPMCGHPLGETNGVLCTKCIMKKLQLQRKSSSEQQQLGRPLSSGEEPLEDEREPQKTKRKEEVLRARQRLTPLYIPRHGDQSVWKTGEAKVTKNKALGAGSSGVGEGGAAAQGTRCLTPNCPSFANPDTQFLCTSCHEKEKKEWEKINKITQRQRPLPRQELRNCLLGNCYNRESPGNNLGLCDKCFQTAVLNERVWESKNRRHPPREPQRLPPAVPQKSSPRKTTGFIKAGGPCKSTGCLRFGTDDKQGYCDKCFEKQQKLAPSPSPLTQPPFSTTVERERPGQRTNSNPIAHEPVRVSQLQTRVFGEGSGLYSKICIQEGCRMTGSAELAGYCSKCFEDYTKQNTYYPESVPDFISEQELPSLDHRTGLTTLPPRSPRTCAMPLCSNQVLPSTVSHCRDCVVQLYPQYASQLKRTDFRS